MLHTQNTTSNTTIVTVYNHTKAIVETTNLSNYNPSILVNISDMHFECKSPNLMTVNFSSMSKKHATVSMLVHS